MRQPRRIIFVGLLGVVLTALAWLVLKPHEPSYQGKTLTTWLEEARAKNVIAYPESDPPAVNAIRQMGTNAIITLLRYAAAHADSPLKRSLLLLKEKQPRLPIHPCSRIDSHLLAEYGFYVLGPDAKAAVPDLTALLKDDDDSVRGNAALCLGHIGPAAQSAVPELTKLYGRGIEMAGTNVAHADICYTALALGNIGPSARSAIPVLTSGLTNASSYCRACAQSALINLHAASINTFLDQVKDTSNVSNWYGVATIAIFCGTNLSPAVPSLVSGLHSTNDFIRYQALIALRYIHQDPDRCLPAIIPFLASSNTQLRYSSINALRRFGKTAEPAVPALMRCLNYPDDRVRVSATNALCEIDPSAAAKAGIK